MTAVKRVDLRRPNAIIIGALNIDTAQLAAPNQSIIYIRINIKFHIQNINGKYQ